MDFTFTETQRMIQEAFRSFAEKELTREYVRWLDESCDFPPDDLRRKLADMGYFGIGVPEEYGGIGRGTIEMAIATEELATASVAVAIGMGIVFIGGTRPLSDFGSEEQKRRYLPDIVSGEKKWSFALTEPAGGTDILGAIATTARRDGDEYVLNGTKIFISGAHVADYILTVAITDKEAPRKNGLSVFIVDARSEGVSVSLIPKVGIHACGTCEVHYEDVRVPAENLIGEENRGWYHLLGTLNPERIATSTLSLGIAKAAFNDALEYSKQRKAFGKPIGQFQIIQNYLADIGIEIENARNLIYKCAWLCDTGQRYDVEAAMAKIVACRASEKASLWGMEILGGYGYTMEYDMQRHFRDYKQMMFSPISDEMSKNYIAQSYGLPRSY
jgi:alkylation response protein AidB-like acyl-CoA dehydrogenase